MISWFILRPSTTEDDEFLYELYACVRQQEVESWGFVPAQTEAFLRMQWHVQRSAYELQFPAAVHYVAVDGTTKIGRCILHETADAIRIVDLALMTSFRNRGHGTAILEAVQRQASQYGKYVILSVRKSNPAQRLYARLGFEITGTDELGAAMRWAPGPADRN